MSAKDYQICPALFKAYIAKVSNSTYNKINSYGRFQSHI